MIFPTKMLCYAWDMQSPQMKDDGPGCVPRNDPHMPFLRFLREDSPWSWRAWIFFCCMLVICTSQAVPSWTHPDLRLGWDPRVCFWIIGISGAVTGFITAQYRFLGSLAGALAGTGSVLAAVLVLEPINSYSRIVLVMVGMIGLLPGVAVYCLLHVVIDRLRGKPSEHTGSELTKS